MSLSVLLGALIGAVLGATGAGGGILAVPALVMGLDWTPHQAAPVALIAVAGGAAVGALEGLRRGLVRYRAGLLMALAGLPSVLLGLWLAPLLPTAVLGLLFALVMTIVALRLLRSCAGTVPAAAPPAGQSRLRIGVNTATGRLAWSWTAALLIAAIGAATGLMTGLLGVGGGFLVVPLLRRHTALGMHGIVATSLLVVALMSGGAVLLSLLHGARPPLPATAAFTAATAAGILPGRRLAARLSAKAVQCGFAALLLLVSVSFAVHTAINPGTG